jgi:hypothetical protein
VNLWRGKKTVRGKKRLPARDALNFASGETPPVRGFARKRVNAGKLSVRLSASRNVSAGTLCGGSRGS